MSKSAIKPILDLMAAMPDMTSVALPELRVLFDSLGQRFPIPPETTIDPLTANGVKAEWVCAAGASRERALLYLHGGGYVMGSPGGYRHLTGALSRAAGAAVLALDYRLAPEHPFPAAIDDAVSAYRWLLDQGSLPARTVIAGDSGGGGLTMATLLALRDRELPMPAAACCNSPWVDLTITAGSYTSKAAVDPLVSAGMLSGMAVAYLNGAGAKTPLASPLFADLSGLPPLLIQVGEDEVLLDDSRRLAERVKEAGGDVTLEVWDGMIHVWHYFYPLLAEGSQAIARIGEFIKSRTAFGG
ncbi:MAG: alpha/beta hydrolase [Blastocatellia bacterium]